MWADQSEQIGYTECFRGGNTVLQQWTLRKLIFSLSIKACKHILEVPDWLTQTWQGFAPPSQQEYPLEGLDILIYRCWACLASVMFQSSSLFNTVHYCTLQLLLLASYCEQPATYCWFSGCCWKDTINDKVHLKDRKASNHPWFIMKPIWCHHIQFKGVYSSFLLKFVANCMY